MKTKERIFYSKQKHKKSDTINISDFLELSQVTYLTIERKSASVANLENSISF
jgi:hypothetical protein